MLTKGKHIVNEVDGIRCTIVESGISANRVNFLKEILLFNGYDVKVAEDKKKVETDPTTFTIAVTDILFNPVIAVYQKKLKTKDGKKVTPAYWRQMPEKVEIPYWLVRSE